MAAYNRLITCQCGSPVEHFCYNCEARLCTDCKALHERNSEMSEHQVVPYAERFMRSYMINLLCVDHDDQCTHWCKDCKKPGCLFCTFNTHNGHDVIPLDVILKEKIAMGSKELINDMKSNIFKEWNDRLTEAKQVTTAYIEKVNWVERGLEEKAEEFHRKVNNVLQGSKKQLECMKNANLVSLYHQEMMVLDGIEKVKEEFQESDDLLQNYAEELLHKVKNNDIQARESLLCLDYRIKVTLPEISHVEPPVPIFTSNLIDIKSMEEMFGRLSMIQDINTPKPSGPIIPHTELIHTPSVVEFELESKHDRYHQSITCTTSEAWVQTYKSTLKLLDKHGSVKDVIQTDFDFEDVALSPQGGVLSSDTDNNCIKSTSQDKKVKQLFKTLWKPCGLCCLQSGNLAVTFYMEGRVIIYSMSGKKVKEFQKDLFQHPYRVAQNKVNNDLYIVDKDKTDCAVKALALNTLHKVQFKYAGLGYTEFCPDDICTDKMGHLLINDCNCKIYRVHILDKNGYFLRYLLTSNQGLLRPVGIDVDNAGNAWVVEKRLHERGYDCKIKIVKYLQ